MIDDGRRIVLDVPYEAALGATARAIQAEGLEIIARVDARERFRTALGHDFRRYDLLEAWVPREALELLTTNLDLGATLPIRFAIFELVAREALRLGPARVRRRRGRRRLTPPAVRRRSRRPWS